MYVYQQAASVMSRERTYFGLCASANSLWLFAGGRAGIDEPRSCVAVAVPDRNHRPGCRIEFDQHAGMGLGAFLDPPASSMGIEWWPGPRSTADGWVKNLSATGVSVTSDPWN